MTNKKDLVDIQFALTQLGGNSDLLARMLDKFKFDLGTTAIEVKQLLSDGNIKEAKLKVHTTKGLSGNLGLKALYECSTILDQQMREDNIDATQINAFVTVMQDTCECLDTIDLVTNAATEFGPQTNANNEHKSIFLERLSRHEFIDDDTLHQYIDSLALNESNKSKVRNYVEELQYAKAIDIINQAQ